MLKKIHELIDGKKTWIVMILVMIGAALQSQGIAIPEIAWQLLAAAGLGAVRSAVSKVEKVN